MGLIGLENVVVARTRVFDLPSRCSFKGVKSVDVYETSARVIIFDGFKAREGNEGRRAFSMRENPLKQAL